MVKAWIPALALLCLGTPLAAQEPHFGLGVALSVPTGKFNSTSYAPAGTTTSSSQEGYDSTVGGQFTVSFPVEQHLALRLDAYGQTTNGQDTAAGYASYNLQHQFFSIGGEVQCFPGTGDAYRYRGGYLLGGLSMDLERFKSSYGDPDWYGYSINRTRLGGLVGCGYGFRPYGYWRTSLEVAFHKTLNDDSTGLQPTASTPATPAADFLRITYSVIF